MQNDLETHLNTLDLPPNANWKEIQSSYRELLKVWHPDKFAHDEKLKIRAELKTKGIIHAFQALKPYFKKTAILERSFGSLQRIITVHRDEIKLKNNLKQPKDKYVLKNKVKTRRIVANNTIRMLRRKQKMESAIAKYMGFVAACCFFAIVSAIGFPNTDLPQFNKSSTLDLSEDNNVLSKEELDIVKNNIKDIKSPQGRSLLKTSKR